MRLFGRLYTPHQQFTEPSFITILNWRRWWYEPAKYEKCSWWTVQWGFLPSHESARLCLHTL